MGYITTEQEPNSKLKLHYTYGNQGQLLTAAKSVNDVPQKTYTCTYDTCGNIRTATDGTTSHSYTYDDSDWADLLTAYDGNALTYDASGNPTSYYNGSSYTMQWRNGRELQNLTKGGKKTNYEYDVDVLRNLKTNADGSYSVYYWLGNPLLAEERHTSTSTKRGSCKMNVLQLPLQFLPAVNFAHRLYSVGNVNTSQVGAYYSAP